MDVHDAEEIPLGALSDSRRRKALADGNPPFWANLRGGLGTFGAQLGLLLQKHFTLAVRAWWFTVVKLLVPIAIVLILFAVVKGYEIQQFDTTERIGPLTRCSQPPCTTLMYSPASSPLAYSYMRTVAALSGLTISSTDYKTLRTTFEQNMNNISVCVSFYEPTLEVPPGFDTEHLYFLTTRDEILDGFVGQVFDDRTASKQAQVLVERAILTNSARNVTLLAADEFADLTIEYAPAPTDRAGLDKAMIYSLIWPPLLILALFFQIGTTIMAINSERTNQLRQGLGMMGLQNGPYWASWFIYQGVVGLFYALTMSAVGTACGLDFFSNTNFAVVVIVLWLAFLCATSFALTLAAWFHNTIANIVLLVLGFLASLPLVIFPAIQDIRFIFWMNPVGAFFSGIFYQVNLGKIIGDINALAVIAQDGFTWGDLYRNVTPPNFYGEGLATVPTTSDNLFYLLAICVFGLVFAWFIDNISPGSGGGIKQPFFFLFRPYYWGFWVQKKASVELVNHSHDNFSSVLASTDIDINREHEYTMKQCLGRDPTTLLRIVHLAKTYKKSKCCQCGGGQEHRALDNLTISGEKGTILAILGHNGAGKTTILNILTGLVAPSSGDAFVLNRSILTDMARLRQRFGVCPQHDILWGDLTPHEHLELIAKLKRVPAASRESEIRKRLGEVDLLSVAKQPVKTFSGGMKRRVSVAMASVGDPDVIFLDEPTTGLDPKNRLSLWKVIESLKKDRLVVLTTHSMEEADALADKIAIMALGNLRAVGSSMHLKNRFGAGYHIEIVCAAGKEEAVKSTIKKLLPDSQLNVEASGNLSYSLPTSRLDMLQKFFTFLETQMEQKSGKKSQNKKKGAKQKLNTASSEMLIQDWGISQTTLEEVFMRLTHGDQSTFAQPQNASQSQTLNIADIDSSDQPLGFVVIDPSSTLADVRASASNIDQMPANYNFIMNGVPVSRSQEDSMFASDFFPLVTVRAAQTAPSLAAPSFDKAELVQLKKRLREEEAKNARLESTVASLKKQIKTLEAKLASLGVAGDASTASARVVNEDRDDDEPRNPLRTTEESIVLDETNEDSQNYGNGLSGDYRQ